MCGPTAPTAPRRRSFRSSDRGRDLVFGSGLGRPGEHDDCLALSRHLQLAGDCRSHEPPRVHLRVAPPARSSPSPFGAAGTGSTQHLPSSEGRVRASGARPGTPPGVKVRGERSLHHVRGQPRKDGGKELEPPAAALRSERWVANESLRRCVAMTSETECLRVCGPTRWTSLRGRSTGIPFVARRGCGRGDSFGRSPEPPRSTVVVPSGTTGCRSQGARQGRNTLPSLHVRVRGRRSGSGRQAKRPARAGQRETRGSVGTSRSKAQGSIERSRDGNVPRTQRTPRWKKALRSRAVRRSVVTRRRVRLQRREGTPAGERDRVRKDEAR